MVSSRIKTLGWFFIPLTILITMGAITQTDFIFQVKNKPFVDIREFGAKCDGTTNDYTAIQNAVNSLPANGGIVRVPNKVCVLGSQLTIGTGSGVTQSTKNNITIEGSGAAGGNPTFDSGSVLKFTGGGTAIRMQGPVRRVFLKNITIDGGGVASILIDQMACGNCGMEYVNLRNLGTNGLAHRMDAVNDPNGNTSVNTFINVNVVADTSGASCLSIGPNFLNGNSGIFDNAFINYYCSYANDTPTSIGLQLGWADNNRFYSSRFGVVAHGGSGYPIKHVQQSYPYNWLPSENVLYDTPFGCPDGCNSFTGDSGIGVGTIIRGYEVFDSSGIDNNVKHVRGFINNGDVFDTDQKITFQNKITVHSDINPAVFEAVGFTDSGVGAGTISVVGTAVTGSGTLFSTQLTIGSTIKANGNEFRRVISVSDNAHCVIESAFSYPLVNAGYSYGTGTIARIYSDSDANFEAAGIKRLAFKTNGTLRGFFDGVGNFTTVNGIFPNNNNVQIRSGAGSPEGVVAGQLGDIWMRTDGGAGTTFYVKQLCASCSTGWAAK